MLHFVNPESGSRTEGSAVVETALMMPIMLGLLLFAIDFGYLFLVAANIVSSSRSAVSYSIQGFSSPAQAHVPSAGTSGSLADTAGVAGIAAGDLSGLANMTSNTQVQVCSKSIGITHTGNGYITQCAMYPSGTASYTPDLDPESSSGMLLQRVDVIYTVSLPVALNLFTFHTAPPLVFHWEIESRAVD